MNSDLIQKMEDFKKDFYNTNGTNTLFKKSQKNVCATEMSSNFNLTEMIESTIFIVPGTNNIFFDYTILKLYANDNNYQIVINHMLNLYDIILLEYTDFNIHMNLNTFSPSAVERYKSMIQKFCESCMNSKTLYSEKFNHMYLYNTPIVIDTIMVFVKPFVDPNIAERITKYNKTESESLIKILMQK